MREKGILFNGPMVRAILEGRKTQTRRMMKTGWCFPGRQYRYDGMERPDRHFLELLKDGEPTEKYTQCPTPPYQPGDRMWVRETFSEHPEQAIAAYRADGEEFEDADGFLWEPKWTPSIHMPRELSRITLEVTDVRVEQVQDISPADCIEEGAWAFGGEDKPIDAYRALWNSIYGPGAWEANPWVWVFCFKVLEVKK